MPAIKDIPIPPPIEEGRHAHTQTKETENDHLPAFRRMLNLLPKADPKLKQSVVDKLRTAQLGQRALTIGGFLTGNMPPLKTEKSLPTSV